MENDTNELETTNEVSNDGDKPLAKFTVVLLDVFFNLVSKIIEFIIMCTS